MTIDEPQSLIREKGCGSTRCLLGALMRMVNIESTDTMPAMVYLVPNIVYICTPRYARYLISLNFRGVAWLGPVQYLRNCPSQRLDDQDIYLFIYSLVFRPKRLHTLPRVGPSRRQMWIGRRGKLALRR